MKVTAQELLQQLMVASNTTRNFIQSDAEEYDGTIQVIQPIMKFQMTNLAKWCEMLGKNYKKEDWDGNKYCDSNYDVIYFKDNGVTFFELIDRG